MTAPHAFCGRHAFMTKLWVPAWNPCRLCLGLEIQLHHYCTPIDRTKSISLYTTGCVRQVTIERDAKRNCDVNKLSTPKLYMRFVLRWPSYLRNVVWYSCTVADDSFKLLPHYCGQIEVVCAWQHKIFCAMVRCKPSSNLWSSNVDHESRCDKGWIFMLKLIAHSICNTLTDKIGL